MPNTKALTKADLLAETTPMKLDIKTLKEDVSTLKEDVSELKIDVSDLKSAVRSNTYRLERLENKFDKSEERNEERYNKIMDQFDGLIGRFNKEEQLWGLLKFQTHDNGEYIKNHEERICALEKTLVTA